MPSLFPRRWRLLVTACLGTVISCSSCNPPAVPFASATVLVVFPGTSASERPLLLYSGMREGTCRIFEVHVGSPSVTLNAVSYDPACPAEVDVFVPNRSAVAMAANPLQPGSENWILQAVASGALSVTLGPPTRVPLKLWLVAHAPQLSDAKEMRQRLLDKAFPILETLGPGLSLDTASAELADGAVAALCSNAGVISSNSAIYDAKRINVYFVDHYGNTDYLTAAMNCAGDGHPEIVFVSWANTTVTNPTLAHELGHALGLVRPQPGWGHTYGIDGFNSGNLMAQGADVTNASIGQLYAMNFSGDSWLNRSGSPLARPVVRTCQNSWGVGTCPALTLFQSGWPQ